MLIILIDIDFDAESTMRHDLHEGGLPPYWITGVNTLPSEGQPGGGGTQMWK